MLTRKQFIVHLSGYPCIFNPYRFNKKIFIYNDIYINNIINLLRVLDMCLEAVRSIYLNEWGGFLS